MAINHKYTVRQVLSSSFDDSLECLKLGATSPTTLLAGTKTTSGAAAEALATSTSCSEVDVQADPSNGDPIYIGNATTQNVTLDGGQSVSIKIDNLSKIYIKRSAGTNLKVNYIGS